MSNKIPNNIIKENVIKKKDLSLISSSNFMCLLNIPNAMNKFGFLRLLWEDANQGEGYLQTVKKHSESGLHGKSKTNIIHKILQEKLLEHVMEKANIRFENSYNKANNNKYF